MGSGLTQKHKGHKDTKKAGIKDFLMPAFFVSLCPLCLCVLSHCRFNSGILFGSGSFGIVLRKAAMSVISRSDMDLLVYGGIAPRGFRMYLMRSSAERVLGVIAGAAPPARPCEPWHDQQKYVT